MRDVIKLLFLTARWLAVAFLLFAIGVVGPFGRLALLAAAFFMAPIKRLDAIKKRLHVNALGSILLAAALFFVGVLTTPTAQQSEDAAPPAESVAVEQITRGAMQEADPTSAPTPEPTPAPTPTPTATPEPTPEQTPEPTPEPTPTPIPGRDYVLNTSTGKIHRPGCSSVNEIAPGNRQDVFGQLEDYLAWGYTACKRCNPW